MAKASVAVWIRSVGEKTEEPRDLLLSDKSTQLEEIERYIEGAVRWAKAQLGSRDWPYRCLAFVEDAYEKGNDIEIFGESCARDSAELYGVVKKDEFPPAGVFVFYDMCGPLKDVYKNWGHVGLSLGSGNVIHSWGPVRIDNYLDIENLKPGSPDWTQPEYIGWTPVDRILEGHRKRKAESGPHSE